VSVVVYSFGDPLKGGLILETHPDPLPACAPPLRPFGEQGGLPAPGERPVPGFELQEEVRRELGPVYFPPERFPERRRRFRYLPHVAPHRLGGHVDVHAYADDYEFRSFTLELHFGEHAGRLPAVY